MREVTGDHEVEDGVGASSSWLLVGVLGAPVSFWLSILAGASLGGVLALAKVFG